MTHIRSTKIVATLGPSSQTKEQITALIEHGANVFRLNFSHGTHEDHAKKYQIIREAEETFKKPIAIMADLQGPKLRIGKFKDEQARFKARDSFVFDSNEELGDNTRVHLPHPEVFKALSKDDFIYLDDGKVRLQVQKSTKDKLTCAVIAGEKLSDHKGFNLPGITLPIPALTDKDKKDLTFALDLGVDLVAQSFVQTGQDVMDAQNLIQGRAKLIVKIEKPAALDHIEDIIKKSDGVLLARGDLGVEIPPEDVPSVQKRIVRYTRWMGKPVIVATQMLESMMESPTPTRAEASDVATAIYDGTDAVMLSGETAAGKYPIEAISIMAKIASAVEQDDQYRSLINAEDYKVIDGDVSDALTVAGEQVAENIDAKIIVNYTTSGSTALRTARQRPEMPVICLTQNLQTARQLCLSYGVHPVHTPDINEFDGIVHQASVIAKYYNYAKAGDRMVLTAGIPFGKAGSTNVLRICDVE